MNYLRRTSYRLPLIAANGNDPHEPQQVLFEKLWRSMLLRLMPKTLLLTATPRPLPLTYMK